MLTITSLTQSSSFILSQYPPRFRIDNKKIETLSTGRTNVCSNKKQMKLHKRNIQIEVQ